jgi:F-type H+-transporting ATPase subunit b
MAILEQLGINQTAYVQFFIFLIAYITLSQVVFKPYMSAYEERERRTKGGEDLAQELIQQSVELKHQYEQKARQVNGEIKTIYDSFREQAAKEYNEILARARAESQKLIEEARLKVGGEVLEAAKKLKEETPIVASAITHKLLAK